MTATPSIALIQTSCSDSRSENLNATVELIRSAAANGAKIVCLQELFASQYFCQTEDHDMFQLAESIPGPTSNDLGQLAAELQIVLVASLFEKRAPGLYHNSAVVLDADGSTVGVYRKMHIPDDPNYYEKFYFTPGDLGFQAFSTRYGKIGVCICWDQWFPEAARLTALQGAELIFFPTAIGWLLEEKESFGASQMAAWETMIRSHAIANGVFVAAPNRTGIESGIEFWGSSPIFDPYGNLLAQGGQSQTEVVQADCDLSTIDVARTHWPFFRDRRIDAYRGLNLRFAE